MRLLAVAVAGLLALAPCAHAQTTPPGVTPGAPSGMMLLTIVLRHDQSKTLSDINAELKRNGFYDRFPPAGCRGGELVCDDGPWVGCDLALSRRAPPRCEQCDRADSLGWLPH